MTEPVTPILISPLPDPPLITDAPAVFNDKAFPFAQALDPFGDQINAIATATNTNAVASKEKSTASAASASASAASALTAAGSVTDAAAQVTLAVAAKDSAEVAAAAAQSAAGLPTLAGNEGKALRVKSDGSGVEWGAAGLEVGGIYQGSKKPTVGVWLDTDAVYLQSSYPVLFAALGLVPGVAPWTQRTPAALTGVTGLAHGNGMYVAVGINASSAVVAASSPDGATWTARVNNAGNAVAFGAGVFVSVAGSAVRNSTDGVTWNAGTIPAGSWTNVIYGGGLFVAAGGGIIATSPDGINWTSRSGGVASGRAAAYGAGRFVILAQSLAGGGVTSTDGITWTAISTPVGVTPNGLAYGNGVFVGVGTFGAVTSPDGITWNSRPMPGLGVGSASYTSVAFYSGRFIAAGSAAAGAPLFADSPDGSTWTARFMPAGGYASILAASGLFIAAGTVMQTAPMFPYDTATQFYVPAPVGVVGLDTWMKAGD